jgi:transketolase
MRNTFVSALCDLAEQDERIWLLCGDLGYSVLEKFAERFPQRYVNVGVAEQNMTGVAAGLALAGKVVFTYSIANFPVMRCLEQVRNDVCYHNLSVKIVAVGGGMPYGAQGYTHHGVEDLAVMRALPNMTVVAPGDPVETRLATKALVEHPGPGYLRLGKGGEAIVHTETPDFRLGRAIILREGDDITLIAAGAILGETVKAADLLAEEGIRVGVISMPTVSLLDAEAVLQTAARSRWIVTVEEHSITGGLGSAVAEVLAEAEPHGARLIRCGVTAGPYTVGGHAYLRRLNHLDAESLVQTVLRVMEPVQVLPWPSHVRSGERPTALS